MTELKVDKDTATAEFKRFAECNDLDIDTADMDAEDLAAFGKSQRRIESALMDGSLIIDDDGQATYTPRNPKTVDKSPITFCERTGASIMAMDGKKKNQDGLKTYAVMADMCKVHPNRFANLVGIDVKVCEAIFGFLMD